MYVVETFSLLTSERQGLAQTQHIVYYCLILPIHNEGNWVADYLARWGLWAAGFISFDHNIACVTWQPCLIWISWAIPTSNIVMFRFYLYGLILFWFSRVTCLWLFLTSMVFSLVSRYPTSNVGNFCFVSIKLNGFLYWLWLGLGVFFTKFCRGHVEIFMIIYVQVRKKVLWLKKKNYYRITVKFITNWIHLKP